MKLERFSRKTDTELQSFVDHAQKLMQDGLIPLFFAQSNIRIWNDNLNNFDWIVLQAVYALILEGNGYVTPAMIYRKMIGTDYTSPINADGENIRKIVISMEKLSSIKRIKIEWLEEAIGAFLGLNIAKACDIIGNLLSYKEIYVDVNYGGKLFRERRYLFHAYKNGNLPPLLSYAIGLGQIAFIPKKLLKDGVRSTPDVIVLRYKIVEFITALKSPNFNDKSGFITYFTLFDNCGFDINPDPNDDEEEKLKKKVYRKRKKALVKRILTHYQKEKSIDSFEEEKRNGQTGIVIQCNKTGDTWFRI